MAVAEAAVGPASAGGTAAGAGAAGAAGKCGRARCTAGMLRNPGWASGPAEVGKSAEPADSSAATVAVAAVAFANALALRVGLAGTVAPVQNASGWCGTDFELLRGARRSSRCPGHPDRWAVVGGLGRPVAPGVKGRGRIR